MSRVSSAFVKKKMIVYDEVEDIVEAILMVMAMWYESKYIKHKQKKKIIKTSLARAHELIQIQNETKSKNHAQTKSVIYIFNSFAFVCIYLLEIYIHCICKLQL